jgi:hypothetical protein
LTHRQETAWYLVSQLQVAALHDRRAAARRVFSAAYPSRHCIDIYPIDSESVKLFLSGRRTPCFRPSFPTHLELHVSSHLKCVHGIMCSIGNPPCVRLPVEDPERRLPARTVLGVTDGDSLIMRCNLSWRARFVPREMSKEFQQVTGGAAISPQAPGLNTGRWTQAVTATEA